MVKLISVTVKIGTLVLSPVFILAKEMGGLNVLLNIFGSFSTLKGIVLFRNKMKVKEKICLQICLSWFSDV